MSTPRVISVVAEVSKCPDYALDGPCGRTGCVSRPTVMLLQRFDVLPGYFPSYLCDHCIAAHLERLEIEASLGLKNLTLVDKRRFM
jgi:hypothetical protein